MSATCGVSTYNHGISGENDFYTSADLYFVFKNNASNATTPSVEIFKDGASVGTTTLQSWSNWNNISIGKLSEGSYTYNLKHNGKVICTHSINVKSPLSCSVDKTTIGLGESFKFTTNYAGSAWGHSLSGNGAPASTGGSAIYTITPTAIGTHTYTFSVTSGDKGSAECSYSVIVEEIAPTITCPADLTGIALNSNITVTPQSLTGCTNGCDYTIDGTSATGSGYTGGEVSFTGESAAGEKTYTWNVSNSKGSDECEFKVTYEEGGSVVPTCNCTCPTGCDNVITTGWNSSNTSGCYFATTFDIGAWNNSVINVNGSEFSNSQKTQNDFTLIDGGFYIQITSFQWPSVNITGGTPNCSGSGGGGSGTDPDPDPGTGDSGDVTIIETFTNATYSAGRYTIKTCSGNVGQKTIQTDSGSSTDCNTWIEGSPSWSAGPWNTCNGQILVTFPMTFTVPEGGSIKMSGNCW